MSTFDGVVEEFPDIRIDYFRASSSQSRSPLAYFLSHVHSDHLSGLESCKSPFIYCSPATRDILLRLEKYPHRMNFAKGILERRTQTYRHLKTLLKAIPLKTPTAIELAPGKEIQVTLFDANHCVGAVMFLIEGGGKAILYTGDIRSELWWVNSLTRHPLLIPYVTSSEPGGRLDCIYLDTTFVVTGRDDPYRHFPSKAEGIKELLQKVAQYPKDTLFYFDSWTFGYEDVWQALSTFLGSRIHVDDYRYKLYLALANGTEPKAPEAQKLIGFNFGNHIQQGCLDTKPCQIHSCEKGTGCEIWNQEFVRVTPIISRYNGVEMAELGAGGGQGDLNQQHELEVSNAEVVGQLMALCASKLQGQTKMLSGVLQMLTSVIDDRKQSIVLHDFLSEIKFPLPDSQEDKVEDMDDMPLEKLVPALARLVTKMKLKKTQTNDHIKARPPVEHAKRADGLPKQITFPYSRHSSYNELCHLIEAFKPKDIHPCTVDGSNWTPTSSMSFLFGHIYSQSLSFRHDQIMLKKRATKSDGQVNGSKPNSAGSLSSNYATPNAAPPTLPDHQPTQGLGGSPKLARAFNPIVRGSEVDKESSRKRRKYRQDDYWSEKYQCPVDHYSPTKDRHKNPASTSPPPDASESRDGPEIADWPNLTGIDSASQSRLQDRWHKRIAEASNQERGDDQGDLLNKPDKRPESSGYGRLSPPKARRQDPEDGAGMQDPFNKAFGPRMRQDLGGLPQTRLYNTDNPSSPVESRMAYRRQAFSAALGSDGYSWSDIGLVSVNGHQTKEEEL